MQLPSSASKGTRELGSNIWLLFILLKRGTRITYLGLLLKCIFLIKYLNLLYYLQIMVRYKFNKNMIGL